MADSFYRRPVKRPLVSFVDGDTVESRARGFDGDPSNSRTKNSFIEGTDALAKPGSRLMESASLGDFNPRVSPEVVSNNVPGTTVTEAALHKKEGVAKVDGEPSLSGDGGGEPKKNKNLLKNGNLVAYGGGMTVMEGSGLMNNETELSAVVSKVWQNVKKIMGFSPECLHGGQKNLRGDCVCPKHFKGDLCETIVCLNNGTRERGPVPAFSYYVNPAEEEFCRCPHPEFISGKHCEVVRCHNGGRDLGNGHCACVDGWYTGQFCQYYTSSWLLAVGLPLLSIAMVIVCCVVCRLDLCPRRSASAAARRDRRSRRYYVSSSSRQVIQPPSGGGGGAVQSFGIGGGFSDGQSFTLLDQEMAAREQARIIQENLLNEARSNHHFHHNYLHHQYASSPNSTTNQYVVRLEQIPTYNPRLFYDGGAGGGGRTVVEPTFKIEPPPSYDQAVLRCPSLNPPANVHLQPPDYTPPPPSLNAVSGLETAQPTPSPPSRPPPNPPPPPS